MPSATIWHAADCPEPITSRVTGRLGDTLERCRNCRRFVVIREPADEVTTELSPEPEAIDRMIHAEPTAGLWVCGKHIDRPVTWRGTGCPDCKADRDAREERRHPTERLTPSGGRQPLGANGLRTAIEVHLPPSYPFPFGTADHE